MNLLHAFFLAIIQGITEWLPVSSSGHLVLYHAVFGVDEPFLYSVILHFSSFFVIAVFFRRKIIGIFRSFSMKENSREGLLYIYSVAAGSLPAAVAGLFFRDAVAGAFGDMRIVAAGWLFTSALLILSAKGREKKCRVLVPAAITIGVFQAAALLPGVSRSGATISAAMILGLKREEAAEFSFILALPALFGAAVLEFFRIESFDGTVLFLIGAVVSFAVGMSVLHLLMRIIKKGKFAWFSLYCFILGAGALLFLR